MFSFRRFTSLNPTLLAVLRGLSLSETPNGQILGITVDRETKRLDQRLRRNTIARFQPKHFGKQSGDYPAALTKMRDRFDFKNEA
jgi:hypothetical protein